MNDPRETLKALLATAGLVIFTVYFLWWFMTEPWR